MNWRGIIPILVLLLFTGCEVFDKEEKIPSYLQIDRLNYPGTTPSGFSCVFVYVNYQIIGVFEVPALIPVLEQGDCRITVRAGIDINDYPYEREIYRLINPFEVRQTLVPGQITTITPQFTTHENVETVWEENFDNSAITILPTDTLTPRIRIVREPRPGNSGSIGQIIITPSDTLKKIFDYSAIDSMQIYFEAVPGFYELSYRSNIPFELRLKTYNIATSLIQDVFLMWVRPSPTDWRRIYINFASVVREFGVGTFYKPYFRVQKLESFNAVDTINLSIDDIRIAYLKRN